MNSKNISIFSWNVRGLGQSDRCKDVLSELISTRPTFASLQETKLQELTTVKKKTFLPVRLSSCDTCNADGAAGGILTAWDSTFCTLVSSTKNRFSLTGTYALNADDSSLTLTNVYAPTERADKPAFMAELASLADNTHGPWMIIGDFNLTRKPEDKSSTHFNHAEADMFNSLINELALIEMPLVDRQYTWSNRRENPTLVRLDRCFINTEWDSLFPNTNLTSRARIASDHVPLVATASTRIPRSCCFRFENAWLQRPDFRPMMLSSLAQPSVGPVAKAFVSRLKHCRRDCRLWAKRLRPMEQLENDSRALLCALDLLEEERPLSNAEAILRQKTSMAIQGINCERLAFWQQRFNIRIAKEWDENSKFFHASASGRRRKNHIHTLEHDEQSFSSHDAKSEVLHHYYSELLGTSRPVVWHFNLTELYPSLTVAGLDLSRPLLKTKSRTLCSPWTCMLAPGQTGLGHLSTSPSGTP
ncbi:unnamed protein product [Urochloa humidicola]